MGAGLEKSKLKLRLSKAFKALKVYIFFRFFVFSVQWTPYKITTQEQKSYTLSVT